MKKIIACLIVFLSMSACKKNTSAATADPTATTVDISTDVNKSYQYDLANVKPGDVMIETAPAHASASKISSVRPCADSTAFIFVPDSNYTGTDQVILSVREHHKHGCGKKPAGKPECKDQDGAATTYILNFTVNGSKPVNY